MKYFNKEKLKYKRKDLRNYSTPAEAVLWKSIKNNKLGRKFRRQHSIQNYILDFYCPKERLCIELDGNDHFRYEKDIYDSKRDNYLWERYNIKTIRIENFEVFSDIEKVLSRIEREFR